MSETRDITLARWVKEETARLQRFAMWWNKQRLMLPKEDWPLKQPPGEWDDQYMMFDDPDAPPET